MRVCVIAILTSLTHRLEGSLLRIVDRRILRTLANHVNVILSNKKTNKNCAFKKIPVKTGRRVWQSGLFALVPLWELTPSRLCTLTLKFSSSFFFLFVLFIKVPDRRGPVHYL